MLAAAGGEAAPSGSRLARRSRQPRLLSSSRSSSRRAPASLLLRYRMAAASGEMQLRRRKASSLAQSHSSSRSRRPRGERLSSSSHPSSSLHSSSSSHPRSRRSQKHSPLHWLRCRLRHSCLSGRCRRLHRRGLPRRQPLPPLGQLAASCRGCFQSCQAICHPAWGPQQPQQLLRHWHHQGWACRRRPRCRRRAQARRRLSTSRRRHPTRRHQAWRLQASTQQQHTRRPCRGRPHRHRLAGPAGTAQWPRAVLRSVQPSAWMPQWRMAACRAGRRRSRSSGQPPWMSLTEPTCSMSAPRWAGWGRSGGSARLVLNAHL